MHHMAVYSTFQFCLLLRAGKETNTVYSTQLISPETAFLSILFPTITKLKVGANKETLLRKQTCAQDAKNVFGKFQKHFLLPRRRFCVFNICCVGEQTRNYLGNSEETLTLNVSRMFPRLRTQATYLENAEFASRKQKCFPYSHPYNIVSNIDSKCFCSNVSSFVPTFIHGCIVLFQPNLTRWPV